MRKAMLLLAIVGLAGSLWAADPDVGTWKLNVAQSKFSPNSPAPKEETLVVAVAGGQKELTVTGTAANGSPISAKYTFPLEGGAVKPVLAGYDAAIVTVVSPSDFYATTLKDGKQRLFLQVVISKDGKTKRETIRGKDAQGKPVDELEVFDKQ